MKNFCIKLFLAFARLFIRQNKGESFLIVSTTGLGDTLWGTPAIRALRKSYPHAYIGILTSPIGNEVLKGSPYLDDIFVVKKPTLLTLARLLPTLLRKKISTVLVFHTSQRPVLPFCALLGASRLLGTEGINKGLDFLLTDKLPSAHIHEIERRLQIVEKAGAKKDSLSMELFPTAADQEKAASLLPGGCVIGLHPGAKDRFKQWAPSHFITLGRELREKYGCTIVVTGTPAEKSIINTITSSIDGAIGLYDQVSIPTFAALLSRLSLYITNDTGPLHIATATKTPTIALFTPTDPDLCGPYFAPHVTVVQKKPTCFPCLRKKCQEPFCMLQISPEEVLKTVEKIL